MIVKRTKSKPNVLLYIILFVFVFYYSLRCFTATQNAGGVFQTNILMNELDTLWKITTPLRLTPTNIAYSGGIALFIIMVIETYKMQYKKNIQENAMGSADWEEPTATEKIRDKDFYHNIILTKTEIVSKEMSLTGMNANICMAGRPGSGKSRYVYKPNLLNADGNSIVCTDPKGELLRDCGFSLKQQGYTIKVLNLVEKWKGNHYNPLHYIKKLPADAPGVEEIKKSYEAGVHPFIKSKEDLEEAINGMIQEDDVMRLINTLMANTKGENIQQQTGDPYWEHATNLYLQSLIYLAKWQERNLGIPCNFERILELIRFSKISEKEEQSKVDFFYEQVREIEPSYIGIKQYDHFKITVSAQKMMVTIMMEATVRISSFNIREVADMTRDDDMELERIGKSGKEGRIAYFIITDPGNDTFNFLASFFYSQVFNIIDVNAKENNGSCAVPVSIFMDEWKQLGDIPRFLEELAYIRGLNAGCIIGVQSLSQLEEKYKDGWETVLDCCDYFLFLGSKSKKTLEYVSEMIGKKTWYKKSSGRTTSKQNSSTYTWDIQGRELAMVDELERLPKGHAILLAGTYYPFYSELYELEKHPRYKEVYEPRKNGDEENDAKKYIHEREMKKTEVQKKWESLIQEYCINHKLKLKNIKLPYQNNEEMTVNLSTLEMKEYKRSGLFLTEKQKKELINQL